MRAVVTRESSRQLTPKPRSASLRRRGSPSSVLVVTRTMERRSRQSRHDARLSLVVPPVRAAVAHTAVSAYVKQPRPAAATRPFKHSASKLLKVGTNNSSHNMRYTISACKVSYILQRRRAFVNMTWLLEHPRRGPTACTETPPVANNDVAHNQRTQPARSSDAN